VEAIKTSGGGKGGSWHVRLKLSYGFQVFLVISVNCLNSMFLFSLRYFDFKVIDDPTGNSYVENPNAPLRDEQLAVVHYIRTRSQDIETGCLASHSC